MPTYEYICNNCKFEFEKYQSINAEPLKKCPKCHKNTLKKVISGGVGIIFKGSGFYETDYKKREKGLEKHKDTKIKPKTETKESNPNQNKEK